MHVMNILIYMMDLFIAISHNTEYKTNIDNTCKVIHTNLSSYNYLLKTNVCIFEKEVSNTKDTKTSSIKYKIDKKGNITDINLQLYYDISSYSNSELKYIRCGKFLILQLCFAVT